MSDRWYHRTLLPRLLDLACGVAPIRQQRARVVPQATGRVLEVGIGSGLNLPFYDQARVVSIVGVDPSQQTQALATRRARQAGLAIELWAVSAERLPFEGTCFDTAVSTFTLCTMANPVAALREIRRVLVPGGKLLFLEHGRAPDEKVRKWQTRLQPCWSKVAGGCLLDRDIPALLRAAGFQPQVQSRYIAGPRIFGYHYWGEAVAA